MPNDYADLIISGRVGSTLFTVKPDWYFGVKRDFMYNKEVFDYPGGIRNIHNVTDRVAHKFGAKWTNVNKSDEYYILNFFVARQGMLELFWLPQWKNTFILQSDISIFDDTIIVTDGFNADTFQGYERIFIEKNNGDIITRHITNVIDNGDGTETLHLETLMTQNITINDVSYIGRLLLTRFDQDELVMEHITSHASQCDITATFIEAPQEYTAEGAES